MSAQVDVTKLGTRVSLQWMGNQLTYGAVIYSLTYLGRPITASMGGFRATDNFAIIADQNSDDCFLFTKATQSLTLLGPKYGTNNVGFTNTEIPVWQNSASTYRVGPTQFQIPNPPGTPSNGFLNLDNSNVPIWTALNEIKVIQGYSFYNWNTSPNGEWTVGQSNIFYGIIGYRLSTNQFFKVYEANVTYTIPRVNDLGQVAIGLPGVFRTPDQFEIISSPTPMTDQIKPFPNPLWMAAYFSYNLRPDYGDNFNSTGNAILVTEGGSSNVARLVGLGKPLIIDPNDYVPSAASLVIAYYIHSQSIAEMESKVRATELKINSGEIPDNPLIIYYDVRNWPDPLPGFLNPERHWVSNQCYRNPGESLAQFDQSIKSELKKLGDKGFTLFPTLMFYTRNNAISEDEVLETFPLIRSWFDIWLDTNSPISIIGLLPFADRRPTGMVTYPSFEDYWNKLTFLNLEVPSRFTGWIPKNSNQDKVLEQILSQSRTQVVLSKKQKDYLKNKLNFNQPPVEPGGAPNKFNVVVDIYNTWGPPRFADEVDAHNFVRAVARRLRAEDNRWGMLTKNHGENQCTPFACGNNVQGGLGVDILVYRFNSGEIRQIDILTDFGPNAVPTWREIDPSEYRVGNNWTSIF